MAGHTPGPWRIWKRSDGEFITTMRGDVAICRLLPPHARLAANARLISAAPDLLAVLQAALAELAGDGIGAVVDVLEAHGRAVIAKVEGRT